MDSKTDASTAARIKTIANFLLFITAISEIPSAKSITVSKITFSQKNQMNKKFNKMKKTCSDD